MLIETLIFSIIALALFVYIFYRLIKENDTKYVPVLAVEAIRNSNKIYNGIEWYTKDKYCNGINSIFFSNSNTN